MENMNGVDLALLSYLGINGRALEKLSKEADPRDLIEVSSLRARKRWTDEELSHKRQKAESFREGLQKFEAGGGIIVGQGGASQLGNLMRAPTPPLCAFMRGDPDLLLAPIKVAIIGTRAPSTRGVSRANELAGRLAQDNILVVSGGAIGIDLAAHKGAIEKGGKTLAILGDPLKPLGNERPGRLLALRPQDLLSTVTLFGPWVQPSKSLFVIRNQYVAALADAVVIIEGRPNSGTLHTARYAKEMGVPVWVVPGDPGDEMAQAANCLLEQGSARAMVRFEYFLSTLKPGQTRKRVAVPQELFPHESPRAKEELEFSATQNTVLKIMKQNGGRSTVDELAESCESTLSALQQDLLMIELFGAVKKQGTEFVVV